jgi:hypothetical protein
MQLRSSFFVAFLTLPMVVAALDLTPNESWRQLETFRIPTLTFSHDGAKIRYQPPANWTVSGDASTLSLYPGQQGAFMQLRAVARPANAAATPEDRAKVSRSFLPPDAAEIVLTEERPSPFTLDGRPSHEFIYSYNAGGQRFVTAVALCDLDARERLATVITARSAEFKAIHDAGISSLFSWSRRN